MSQATQKAFANARSPMSADPGLVIIKTNRFGANRGSNSRCPFVSPRLHMLANVGASNH